MVKTGIIIVAGGSGSRMGGAVPKQFMPMAGREVLVWTLGRFFAALPGAETVVVLPAAHIPIWEEIAERHGITGTHKICAGGGSRFESVRRGLAELGDCDIIAIHDGVRPLVSEELIKKCVGTAAEKGTAIPVVEPADSYRVIRDGYPERADRSILRAVQTPQVFRADIIREAYRAEYSPSFTDDASVAERSGIRLSFCEGEYRNIKITRPDDLLFAEAVMMFDGE